MPQESERRSAYSSHIKTVNDLLKNFELVRKFRSIFHYGENLKRGFNYKIPTEEENDEFIALLIDLGLAEYDWNELKKQKHREAGNRLIEFRFNGDKILDIFDRLECRKPIIRKPTLEKISVQLANIATGLEIVEYLKSWGVPEGLIEYPNTKWRTVFGVLSYYANSPDQEDHKMLLKIIAEILHPLLYSGSWERSQEVCKEFNDHLFYDNYVARWAAGSKRYIVEYEPSEDDEALISAEQEEYYETLWAEDRKNELAFWENPKNREAVSTLRKAYQTLINIVEIFCENPSKPTDELNDAYLKAKRIVAAISNTLCADGKDIMDIHGTLSGGVYCPFNNLFSAEVTAKNRGETISWDSIRPRMHSAYGDIDGLFQQAQGSDVISTPDTQKTLNDVSMLLSKTKEKNEAATHKPTLPKREPLEVILVSGSKVAVEKPDDEPRHKFPHKLPRGTKWENITIKFLDDDTVQILVQGKTHTTNYRDMGFDGKGIRPSVLWAFLRVLAMYSGEIKATDPKAVDTYKKQKQSLSEKLEDYFGLFDPFYPFQMKGKTDKSYRVKFSLLPPDSGFAFENKKEARLLEKPVKTDPFADLGSFMSDTAPVVAQKEDMEIDER